MKSSKVTLSYILLTVLICSICVGCASMRDNKRMNTFNERLQAYAKMLRWGDYAQAAAMRRARDGELEPMDIEPFKEIRVTSFRITRRELSSDKAQGIVTAAIEYYHERESRIRTLNDRQKWWFDEKQETWYLEGDLPVFF